jgi:hypothetical protein
MRILSHNLAFSMHGNVREDQRLRSYTSVDLSINRRFDMIFVASTCEYVKVIECPYVSVITGKIGES